MSRVLIIDDDAEIAAGISLNLTHEGYLVCSVNSGEAGLDASRNWCPDLVILDLLLPGIDGYEVLRTLRAEGFDAPVLILSALGGEVERIRGFRVGADDYVVKPFALLELVARVEAILRRVGATQSHSESDLCFGALVISPRTRRVALRDKELTLRPKAFDLLAALARRPYEVFSRERLLVDIWGYQDGVESRTVDWHISELRRCLEGGTNEAQVIQTVRAVGYRFSAEAARQLGHVRAATS